MVDRPSLRLLPSRLSRNLGESLRAKSQAGLLFAAARAVIGSKQSHPDGATAVSDVLPSRPQRVQRPIGEVLPQPFLSCSAGQISPHVTNPRPQNSLRSPAGSAPSPVEEYADVGIWIGIGCWCFLRCAADLPEFQGGCSGVPGSLRRPRAGPRTGVAEYQSGLRRQPALPVWPLFVRPDEMQWSPPTPGATSLLGMRVRQGFPGIGSTVAPANRLSVGLGPRPIWLGLAPFAGG